MSANYGFYSYYKGKPFNIERQVFILKQYFPELNEDSLNQRQELGDISTDGNACSGQDGVSISDKSWETSPLTPFQGIGQG